VSAGWKTLDTHNRPSTIYLSEEEEEEEEDLDILQRDAWTDTVVRPR